MFTHSHVPSLKELADLLNLTIKHLKNSHDIRKVPEIIVKLSFLSVYIRFKMPWFNLKFYISLSYCLPSMILYTLLMITLIRNWKDFKSGFFKIVIADYFFNLLTFLNSFLAIRLPNGTCKTCLLSEYFGGMPEGVDFPKIDVFWDVSFFLYLANAPFQYSMVVLMSLNRVTSMFFFFNNEKIWKYLFPLSLLTIILLTVCSCRTIISTSPFYRYSPSMDMYKFISTTNFIPAYNNILLFLAISSILTVLLNLVSVVKLKMQQQKLTVPERNLLLIAIFSSFVQCFAAGNTFFVPTSRTDLSFWFDVAMFILPFSSDLLTIGQPYILLIFSSKVRKAFMKMFWNRKPRVSKNGPDSVSRSIKIIF